MEEKSLYRNIKTQICRMIYKDIYKDGENIPPERKLAEDLGVSRVTVRKALKLLEEEHIIERVQGSGTRVALEYGARTGNMDIITLVAPAQNTFFSRFVDAFQTTAEAMDSLVLYKQKPSGMSLEECLFRIYEKDLRNVVLWLEDMEISYEALRKLRGLGMNMVLFDSARKNDYADAVCLDNSDAVATLIKYLRKANCHTIGFVGWDDETVGSVKIREEEFLKLCPEGTVVRIPRKYHNHLDKLEVSAVKEYMRKIENCDGILYAVGELAVPFERIAIEKSSRPVALIDEAPGVIAKEIFTVDQDFPGMSERIFDCLKQQNQRAGVWKAELYQVKGIRVHSV